MVDFVALRNQILHGEGIEPVEREPSKVEKESFKLSTGIPLFVGLSTLAFIGLDRFKLKMLGTAATKCRIPFWNHDGSSYATF